MMTYGIIRDQQVNFIHDTYDGIRIDLPIKMQQFVLYISCFLAVEYRLSNLH